MKKNKGYYVLVVLGVLVFLSLSCERHTSINSLRILTINEGSPMHVDIADWATIPDPDSPGDSILTYFVSDYIIPIEASYVEQGLGLPTYPTEYTARITDYKLTFRHQTITSWVFTPISGGMNMIIPSDPTGRTTVTADIKIIPTSWLQYHFADSLENNDPNTFNCGVLKATLVLNGFEELTHETVTDTAFVMININDYYDDPIQQGQ